MSLDLTGHASFQIMTLVALIGQSSREIAVIGLVTRTFRMPCSAEKSKGAPPAPPGRPGIPPALSLFPAILLAIKILRLFGDLDTGVISEKPQVCVAVRF